MSEAQHATRHSEIRIDPLAEPNCIGYALYAIGAIPSEAFISPGSPQDFETLFERVASLEEADVIAAVGDVNSARRYGSEPILHLSHMAVVDKLHTGYVSQRARQGAEIEPCVSIEEAFMPYIQPHHLEDVHELWYLRLKQVVATTQ